MKHKIYIQVWHTKPNTENNWACMEAVSLEVENPAEVAQSISDVTGSAVRLTYHLNGITDVSCLNGAYFVPKVGFIKNISEIYPNNKPVDTDEIQIGDLVYNTSVPEKNFIWEDVHEETIGLKRHCRKL